MRKGGTIKGKRLKGGGQETGRWISKIYDFNTVQSKTEHFGTKIAGERQQEKFVRGGNDDKQ